ncbi:MAG: cadherin-like domain-containing protein [Bacteroidales bacterium]|nr:cadherin-like domain-containing protein [Bacteroidales bacterium]MBN2699736.1 cadherin-like domain-containing protein [Bacteroidales bacterium]
MKHIKILLILFGCFLISPLFSQVPVLNEATESFSMPFRVVDDHLAIWNGRDYVPVFIKGINLGVSVPGTQPGELAATREDYRRWFGLIKNAGYNAIRLYTLHYPRFYEELRLYNESFPGNPLFVLHGVWLEEQEIAGDLYTLSNIFDQEIREVVRAVHGDIIIDQRFGKAFGEYTADISPWVMGYIIGREIYPSEVQLTNDAHSGDTEFSGSFYALQGGGDPAETWIVQRLENLIAYEYGRYNVVRPAGISSWPTLDPLHHPTEQILPGSSEDMEKIDLANVIWPDSSAGFFIGYHAYPYYPDFITSQPEYAVESDLQGPNNYLGYLKDLKNHYRGVPLFIAEFGVPTSWGSGHLSPTGMHHGGITEEQQGEFTIRMLANIEEAGCAGGIQFSLIDEWFKQTWITNPFSDSRYRHLWHNITAPEQNFGILSFASPPGDYSTIGAYPGHRLTRIRAFADYDFFRIRTFFNTTDFLSDTLWIALDTYRKELGESLLPNKRSIGTSFDTLRAEFLLMVPPNEDQATLFVIPPYDIYGVKNLVRLDTVVSGRKDAGEWNIVRWKTNYFYNVTQYLGKLNVSASEDPYQFLNAVTRFSDSLEIRIPWTLINFYAPTRGRVLHYQTYQENDEIKFISLDSLTDGIALTMLLDGELYQTSRYVWNEWDYERVANNPPLERKKQSYHFLKEHLCAFNNVPVGRGDSYLMQRGEVLDLDQASGLLANDFDIDGNELYAALSFGNGTSEGQLYLHPDGGFQYIPEENFVGRDYFMYYLDDGTDYSSLIPVSIHVDPIAGDPEDISGMEKFIIFPNPGTGIFTIRADNYMSGVRLNILDVSGRMVGQQYLEGYTGEICLENCTPGIYLFNFISGDKSEVHKVVLESGGK